MVPPAAGPVGGAGRRHGVERLADRAVPDRVEMHLEAAGVDGRDRRLQLLRVEEAGPGACGLTAMAVEIGSQHGGREVLADPVLHDLHAGGAEAATPVPGGLGGPVPALREPVELPGPGPALPPERADHPGGEQAAPLGLKVGVEAVGRHRVVADDRLLPGGDAQRVQVALALADAGYLL